MLLIIVGIVGAIPQLWSDPDLDDVGERIGTAIVLAGALYVSILLFIRIRRACLVVDGDVVTVKNYWRRWQLNRADIAGVRRMPVFGAWKVVLVLKAGETIPLAALTLVWAASTDRVIDEICSALNIAPPLEG